MRKCSKCKQLKPSSQFSLTAKYCKICTTVIEKDKIKTIDGLSYRMYKSQRQNSKNRGHEQPNYTLKEFRNWLYINKIEFLFKNWVNSNYSKNMIPSCDRLDDYKSYTLDNIRLVTWEENNKKHYKDRIEGINNKASKAVIQYTKEGVFIKEFPSLKSAGRAMGIHPSTIMNVCKNKAKSSKGFIWKYK